eukprot:Em0014g24a
MDCEMVGCLEIHIPQGVGPRSTSGGGVTHSTLMKPQTKKKKKAYFSELSVAGKCSVVNYEGDILFDKFINPEIPVHSFRTKYSGIRRRDLNSAMPLSEAKVCITELLNRAVLVAGLAEGAVPSLKKLTERLLGQVIQVGPHSSLEDAMSAMHLYKLVEEDWEESKLHTGKGSSIGMRDRTMAPAQEEAV